MSHSQNNSYQLVKVLEPGRKLLWTHHRTLKGAKREIKREGLKGVWGWEIWRTYCVYRT